MVCQGHKILRTHVKSFLEQCNIFHYNTVYKWINTLTYSEKKNEDIYGIKHHSIVIQWEIITNFMF